ncbi:hypothetical protein ABID22_003399 [Pontibacter aydingkolensis]
MDILYLLIFLSFLTMLTFYYRYLDKKKKQ